MDVFNHFEKQVLLPMAFMLKDMKLSSQVDSPSEQYKHLYRAIFSPARLQNLSLVKC